MYSCIALALENFVVAMFYFLFLIRLYTHASTPVFFCAHCNPCSFFGTWTACTLSMPSSLELGMKENKVHTPSLQCIFRHLQVKIPGHILQCPLSNSLISPAFRNLVKQSSNMTTLISIYKVSADKEILLQLVLLQLYF